jgi:hypothetical protein
VNFILKPNTNLVNKYSLQKIWYSRHRDKSHFERVDLVLKKTRRDEIGRGFRNMFI